MKAFEKVNPSHPDKIADRIAGAIVDMAYSMSDNPKVAVEVLLGHNICNIIVESSEVFHHDKVHEEVGRIAGRDVVLNTMYVPQDPHLASNQSGCARCGDNGIFRGCPVTDEQRKLTDIAKFIYHKFPFDGKYIIRNEGDGVYSKYGMTVCQSHMSNKDENDLVETLRYGFGIRNRIVVNPLGEWTGGIDVDSGATNRKLGSDMGDGATGGGLCGKDCTKSDVSVNIFCFLKAQEIGKTVFADCSIGDRNVDFYTNDGPLASVSYGDVVDEALRYIRWVGGFEKFAEWGLIR